MTPVLSRPESTARQICQSALRLILVYFTFRNLEVRGQVRMRKAWSRESTIACCTVVASAFALFAVSFWPGCIPRQQTEITANKVEDLELNVIDDIWRLEGKSSQEVKSIIGNPDEISYEIENFNIGIGIHPKDKTRSIPSKPIVVAHIYNSKSFRVFYNADLIVVLVRGIKKPQGQL